jgi:hypothetical protein
MGICPTVFGPYFWSVIHMTAMSAGKDIPPEKAQAYIQFFESMPDILPCAQCGKHLRENLSSMPPDTSDLFRWSVDLHNLVNSQLNKPEVSYDKALRYWSTRCSKTSEKDMTIIALCIFVIIVILIFVFKKK